MDMREIRAHPEHLRFETKTDAAGRYKLFIPVRAPNTRVSLDAFAPGYGSFAGSHMMGGQVAEVILRAKGNASYDFKLGKALYVAGVVVNSEGKEIAGVEITALAVEPESYGYVTVVQSQADGKFEIFDFPLGELKMGRGELVFEHPKLRRTEIKDVYTLPDAQRRQMRVVMERGRAVKGKVLTQGGEPLAGVMVEARFNKLQERKAVVTKGNGEFVLQGLPEGKCTLVAHALEKQQKVKHTLKLTKDYEQVQLRLKPIPAIQSTPSVRILGMELVDLNKQLRDVYDVRVSAGALVVNPGNDHARLNIGGLVKGDCFWLVGNTEVTNAYEFINELLRNVERRDDGSGTCRVVYSYRRVDSTGTSTQYIELTAEDLKELDRVRNRLDTEQGSNPQAERETQRKNDP